MPSRSDQHMQINIPQLRPSDHGNSASVRLTEINADVSVRSRLKRLRNGSGVTSSSDSRSADYVPLRKSRRHKSLHQPAVNFNSTAIIESELLGEPNEQEEASDLLEDRKEKKHGLRYPRFRAQDSISSDNPLSPKKCFPDSNSCILDLKSVTTVTVEVTSEPDDDQDGIAATPATTANDDAAGSETEDEGVKVSYNDTEPDADSTVGSSFGGCNLHRVDDIEIQQSPNPFCSSSNAPMSKSTFTMSGVSRRASDVRTPSPNSLIEQEPRSFRSHEFSTNAGTKTDSNNDNSVDPDTSKPCLLTYSSTASLVSTGSLGLDNQTYDLPTCNIEESGDMQQFSTCSSPVSLHTAPPHTKLSISNATSSSSLCLNVTSSDLLSKSSKWQLSLAAKSSNVDTVTSSKHKIIDSTTSQKKLSISNPTTDLKQAKDPHVVPRKRRRVSARRSCGLNAVLTVAAAATVASTSLSATIEEPARVYPLRSRIRQEVRRRQWQEAQTAQKSFEQLPAEVLLRILQYLSIQDLFRVQRVTKRLRAVVDRYLMLVKRVNFSNGLPFAFLPDSLDDAALKRILSRTPEVTHILGFYPRRIQDVRFRAGLPGVLSYAGIIDAFKSCSNLRSVELMDVELMSRLVQSSRVKFHGMFRNRPDSWDSEYAVSMPLEPQSTQDEGSHNESEGYRLQQRLSSSPYFSYVNNLFNTLSTTSYNTNTRASLQPNHQASASAILAHAAASFAHRAALKGAPLTDWFEPISETPLIQGSPSTPYPHFVSTHTTQRVLNIGIAAAAAAVIVNPQQDFALSRGPFLPPLVPLEADFLTPYPQGAPRQALVMGDPGPMVALAIAAAFVPPQPATEGLWGRLRLADIHENITRANAVGGGGGIRARVVDNLPVGRSRGRGGPQDAVPTTNEARFGSSSSSSRPVSGPGLFSPLPSLCQLISLPAAVANLTKLDLVSVAINTLPRLDNIKYLHLKWVLFPSGDPFVSFSAQKLQSFVMNNCIGPRSAVKFVRIFAALSRATSLMRMELVGTRFVDGLIEHIIDTDSPPARCFRNLQRLVLAGNKDSTEMDVGLLLVAGQQSLCHVALQIWHTRNSLFEALSHAGVRLMRLEGLVLGYQDPYQSRLTVSEMASLDLVDSADNLTPMCTITNRGLATMFTVCPCLTNLTLRHSPYVTAFPTLAVAATATTSTSTNAEDDTPVPSYPLDSSAGDVEEPEGQQVGPASAMGAMPVAAYLPLRSLTLENCPNISVEELENILSTGNPFGCLDSLVLRDMIPLRRETSFNGTRIAMPQKQPCSWMEQWSKTTTATAAESDKNSEEPVNWRKLGLLLSIADHLSARRVAFAPLAPTGVGLGASVRDVNTSAGHIRLPDHPVKPFDTFFTLRTHTYLSSLLQLDGSCGPLSVGISRIADLLFHPKPFEGSSTLELDPYVPEADFVSRSTQTCVCGLLEWDFVQRLETDPQPSPNPSSSSKRTTWTPCGVGIPPVNTQLQQQLGGPLAFHPYLPAPQHVALYQFITSSEWNRQILASSAFANMRDKMLIHPLQGSGECPGCASNIIASKKVDSTPPSAMQLEWELVHRPRAWLARDACVDTSELRCFTGPKPAVLTICQPIAAPFSYLTTLHFEKVGISHLVLTSAPRLKNITLENCPALTGIIVHPLEGVVASLSPTGMDPLPALRRVRIIRCPKFAIYHWLYTVAQLYPQHDENIFITYRPFGPYNEKVEHALWDYAHDAHVMVSHDYTRHESERAMEESQSSFDQRFREVMNFSDTLIKRYLVSRMSCSANVGNPFVRSEYGTGWDLVTDIPWVHEGCSSMMPSATESNLSDQLDQLYELVSEVQSPQSQYKICRRGIHLHIQYRDVHGGSIDEDELSRGASRTILSPSDWPSMDLVEKYMNWPYTESYLASVHPAIDFNVWGDGYNEALTAVLPPRPQKSLLNAQYSQADPLYRLLLGSNSEEKFAEVVPGKKRRRDSVSSVTSRKSVESGAAWKRRRMTVNGIERPCLRSGAQQCNKRHPLC